MNNTLIALMLYDDFCKKNNYENHYNTFYSVICKKFNKLFNFFYKKKI